MKRLLTLLGAAAIALTAMPALAQDKLVISIWGGSWRDMVANTAAKKFTAETGVPVEFITGGTIDRLNKAKLAKGNPESDLTFTTSHVGWLYANDGLYETLDLSKIPNAKNLVDTAKISPYHIGTWAYVYTIGYRSDLIKDLKFESWADLWKPEMKGKLAAPDFDPSHIITISALLSGGDAGSWEKGQDKLKALKPSFKAFYTNDANSQQLLFIHRAHPMSCSLEGRQSLAVGVSGRMYMAFSGRPVAVGNISSLPAGIVLVGDRYRCVSKDLASIWLKRSIFIDSEMLVLARIASRNTSSLQLQLLRPSCSIAESSDGCHSPDFASPRTNRPSEFTNARSNPLAPSGIWRAIMCRALKTYCALKYFLANDSAASSSARHRARSAGVVHI